MKVLQIDLKQVGNNAMDVAQNTGCMVCLSAMVRYINKYSPNGEMLDRNELMKAIVFAAQELKDKHETDGIINEINLTQCQKY